MTSCCIFLLSSVETEVEETVEVEVVIEIEGLNPHLYLVYIYTLGIP